ncbi:kynurenine 3-monooxygenase, mitochondrial precursor [Sorochytrium milnesiophthora]
MASTQQGQRSVTIVGAGLVGALAALYFAQDGWKVAMFEQRSDLRKEEYTRERSINLALSERGIRALKNIPNANNDTDLLDLDAVWKEMVPMRARMVHSPEGQLRSLPYGVYGESINSIDRRKLNETLMTLAESRPHVKLYFEHELRECDLDDGKCVFWNRAAKKEMAIKSDLILGADGAHSVVRRELMKKTRMNYRQEYISHAYLELTIPAATSPDTGKPMFAMDPNHLHIWPRHEYMMIALPNPDCSFTCTVFAPFEMFDKVHTEEDLRKLFETEFKDALPHFDYVKLTRDWFSNPRGPLISIKCSPYHYGDRALFIGDAAHAMVPFYGQGMNAGFEDVTVLFDLLHKYGVAGKTPTGAQTRDSHGVDTGLATVLEQYTVKRSRSAEAICDLAMLNYDEMRSHVASPLFVLRKRTENLLHRLFPSKITPLYTMVAFTHTPYEECIQRGKKQKKLVNLVLASAGVSAVMGVAALATWRFGWADEYRHVSPRVVVTDIASALGRRIGQVAGFVKAK